MPRRSRRDDARALEVASRSPLGRDARAIFDAALEAVDPAKLVAQRLAVERGSLVIRLGSGRRPLRRRLDRVWMLAVGKASEGFAGALHALAPRLRGIVIGKAAARSRQTIGDRRTVVGMRRYPADHPIPGPRSFVATHAALAQLARRPRSDTVLLLLSGGASAMLAAPAVAVRAADETALNRVLLGSGAPIAAVNAIRKHVSLVKGGGLLRLAAPREVVTLALSDVIGDDLSTIGSGPAVADPTTFMDALRAIDRVGIRRRLPVGIVQHLERGAALGSEAETVKPGDPLLARSHAAVIGSNALALAAAAAEARRRGYRVITRRAALRGEAARVATEIVSALPRSVDRPTFFLAGGETTVTVGKAAGRGGRSQELAVAAARALDRTGWTLLAGGTDGIDGQTRAAGGYANGTTARRAGRAQLRSALRGHDSYPLLASLGDLLITGPTGTNVMDLVIALHPGAIG